MEAHCRGPDVNAELGTERIDGGLDLLGIHPLAPAAHHARREPGKALLCVLVDRRAALPRDDDGDERDDRRALAKADGPAAEIEAIHETASSGITRITV